jgi:hypothetical protein
MAVPDQIKTLIRSAAGGIGKHKVIVGVSAGAVVFVFMLSCCSGVTWYVASDFAARRERERIAVDKEKAIQEAKEAWSKIFSVPADKKSRAPISEWLTPDRAAIVDGIKVELLYGSIGKVRLRNDFGGGSRLSDKAYLQIKIRVTNNKENLVLEYSPWGYGRDLRIVDNFDNSYKQYHDYAATLMDAADVTKLRVDPGRSIDDLIAFDTPLESSTEFRLELPGHSIRKDSATVAYKLPRSFFASK